jgi:hypothetical protein
MARGLTQTVWPDVAARTKAVAPLERELVAERLLAGSARRSFDPTTAVDWAVPQPDDLFYCTPEHVSLYGTPLWERMSLAQQIELSRQEIVNIMSMGIWFETILMRMLLKMAYEKDPESRHVQYAHTEVADECRHSLMFIRMIETVGAVPYGRPEYLNTLGRYVPVLLKGAPMWVGTLMGEEIVDVLQREMLKDDRVQPLVKQVSRIHVIEESRHVKYARQALARRLPKAGRVEREHSKLTAAESAVLVAEFMVNPAVYRRVGLPDPALARRIAKANPHHIEVKRRAAAKVLPFFEELGLLSGPVMRRWRTSGFAA